MSWSKEKFFEMSQDLLCIVGVDGYFKELNPAWEITLGYTLKELKAKPFVEFIHPEDRERSVRELAKAAAGGEKDPVAFVNRYLTKSGACRSLAWRGSVLDGFGYAIARDITDRLIQERQLLSISQHAPGVLYQFRLFPDGRADFPFVSARAREVFEMSEEELRRDATPLIALLHPEDAPGFLRMLDDSARRLSSFRWEGRMLMPDGRHKWLRAASEPRRLDDGSTLWDGLVMDVTREKEVETLLREQQAKMVNSSKLAALGEMAGGVAHEINNPLAILKGYSSQIRKILAEKPTEFGKAIEAAERMEATIDRIARIVTGLRRVSRNTGGDASVLAPVSELVTDVLSLCTERFRAHGIRLDVSVEPQSLNLFCRPVEISQVLLNLMNNSHDAVEGLPEKWVCLEVREEGKDVLFSVTDSGGGIPPYLRDKIMLPFFTTKEVGRGTGLGLSISRSIVESHGGTLTLDGTCGRTRFVVRMPK